MTRVVTIHGDPFVDPGAHEISVDRVTAAEIMTELKLCKFQRLLGETLEAAADIPGPLGIRLAVALARVVDALPK